MKDQIKELETPCTICKQIGEELKKEIKGNEDEKKEIIKKKDYISEIISASLERKKDDLGRKRAINCGISEAFLHMFTTQPLETISYENIWGFLVQTYPCSDEVKQLLFQLKPYPALIHLFDHSDIYVVENSITSIQNILLCGYKSDNTPEQHDHFDTMIEIDGIKMIFDLFKRNVSKLSKGRAAICLGQLYKAREITNLEMKQSLIAHLKTLINDTDEWTKNAAKRSLRFLAYNAVNKAEIEKDGFKIPE
ncbi:MAG: hypothetical protein EZS28_042240 [Streblomastix strix]|uniref:Uncharacterized protein n=1 Tax=Streblomastix strix TaxID=222440 RepID=A0A5J4TWE2_9EUKA|nr:MAG: hypothetical protein EZS28_042240 [Streblomastix strix]